jgi:virginiamycin B lyase
MKLRTPTLALAGALITALALPASGLAVTGTITEFSITPKTPASMPFAITAGPDGNLWFTEAAGQKVGRITPSGTIDDFAIAGAVSPRDITLGPTGTDLWVTDQGANKVFQVKPNANAAPTITPGIATLTTPRGIASISGELWVANAGGTVQKVKPDGSADGAPIPTTGTNLQFSTKGPDNNFWSTDFNGGLIKVTTGAAPTASPVSIGANKNPLGITSGPDGKLYLAEAGGPPAGEKIARVNPDGSGFQETSALTGGATDPEGVAFGQDGNLYVAIFNGGQIGQVSPALGLTQFHQGIPGTTGPRTIARGPDGNMWFTDETANAIGRFTVDPPPAPPAPPSGGGGTTSTGTTGATGGGATPPAPVDNSGTPQVSNVAVKPARFRVGASATAVSAAAKKRRGAVGTTISYLLTKDATATLTFEQAVQGRKRASDCVRITRRNRNGKKCTRFVPKGQITRTGSQGQDAVPFSGRIGNRALRPGRYRVGVAGTDAQGRSGLFQYATFVILPPVTKKERK